MEGLFGMVLFTAILTALITFIGYSTIAELVSELFIYSIICLQLYSLAQQIFCRSEYRKYLQSWNELRHAKRDLSSVSAQVREKLYLGHPHLSIIRMNLPSGLACSARWISFKVSLIQTVRENSLPLCIYNLDAARKRHALATQLALSVFLRILVYGLVAVYIVFWNAGTVVMRVPPALFGPATSILALPLSQSGVVSLPAFYIISAIGMKHLLGAFSV